MASAANYQRIADELMRVNGRNERVRVEYVGSIKRIDTHAVIGGTASWDGEAYVIEMIRDLGGDEDSIFAHELSHILLGHVNKAAPSRGEMTPLERGRTYFAKLGKLAPAAQAKHDREETEANELAERICKAWPLTWAGPRPAHL